MLGKAPSTTVTLAHRSPQVPRMHFSRLAVVVLLLAAHGRSQTISRTSAPAVGRTLTVEYTASAGNVYAMLLSAPPFGSLLVPPWGRLFLDPASLLVLYASTVPATGVDGVGVPLPNNPGLVDLCLGMQALDATAGRLSSNFAEICMSAGIGTITVGAGSSSSTNSFVLQTVVNATAGRPAGQALGPMQPEYIYHLGLTGFRPLTDVRWLLPGVHADLDVDKGTSICQDNRAPSLPHISLPNGFDLYVMRDAASPRTFFLMSLDRATGLATQLTGSTVTDTGVSAMPFRMYGLAFAFSPDGATAVAVVHDSATPGPGDRIFIVKTDPARTFANGRNVFDVTPPAGPDALVLGQTAIGALGFGLVFGTTATGFGLWGGPTDGSALWSRIPVPASPCPFSAGYYWRRSDDGSVIALGSNSCDVMVISNLGAGPPVLRNITRFAAATLIRPWNDVESALELYRSYADVSPDGGRVAFLTSAAQLCVVRSDGSDAGSVTPVTQGRFAAQINQIHDVSWVSNTRVVFFAGRNPFEGDLYTYDTSTTTFTNVTRTTTGSLVPPFTSGGTPGDVAIFGTLLSDNGRYLYFLRGFPTGSGRNSIDWKGLDTATLAVFDVTGTEFSAGSRPALRPLSSVATTLLPRRHPLTNELFFVAAKDTGTATTFADDEVWRFDPEAGTAAVQVTANNGTGGSAREVRRVGDLVLERAGTWVAWSWNRGFLGDVFITPAAGGASRRVSPVQGLALFPGSLRFTPPPVPGIAWVHFGGNAFWNGYSGATAPLRLATSPFPLSLLNTSPLNP